MISLAAHGRSIRAEETLVEITRTIHKNICTAKRWEETVQNLLCKCLPVTLPSSPPHHRNSRAAGEPAGAADWHSVCWWMCRPDGSMCLPNRSCSTVTLSFSVSLSLTLTPLPHIFLFFFFSLLLEVVRKAFHLARHCSLHTLFLKG